MIIKEVSGNLVSMFLDRQVNMIHGCNCFCTMGRGIALEVRNRVPLLYEADRRTIAGSKEKLGHFTYTLIDDMVGINAYTQYHFARPIPGTSRMVDYDAVRQVFRRIDSMFGQKPVNDKPFGIPLIGAGLAKGDWSVISKIIDDETPSLDIILVHFEG